MSSLQFTPKDIHEVTKIPQQIINHAVKDLLQARLLVEIRSGEKGSFEESIILHPIEKIDHLTYGAMIERLFTYGADVVGLAEQNLDGEKWKDIDVLNAEFVEKGKNINFV